MNSIVKKVLFGLGFAAQKAAAIVVGKVATDQCFKRGLSLEKSVVVGAAAAVATDTALEVVREKVVDYINDKEFENELDIEDFDYGDLNDEEFDAMYEKYLKDHGYTEDSIAKSFEDLVFGTDDEDDEPEDTYEETDVAEEITDTVEAVEEVVEDKIEEAAEVVEEAKEAVEEVAETVIENVVEDTGDVVQVAKTRKTPAKKKGSTAKKA